MFYYIDLAGFAGPVVCVPCRAVQSVPHRVGVYGFRFPVPDISPGM